MGAAALTGALINAGFSIAEKKKIDPDFKFEKRQIIDTVWQSTGAGLLAGVAIGCGYYGLAIAALTGIGVDKVCNKVKIGKKQFLNLIGLVANFVQSKDK